MRFADLAPRWGQRYATFTPERGGENPLPEMWMIFRCPKCGSHYSLQIIITTEAHTPGKWHVEKLPDSIQWPETATVAPSIQCHQKMHGVKGPDCNAHFSIIGGEIVP